MSIFSNWGKGKTSDTDPQDTADRAEQAKKEIEAERQAFRDSLRVETTDNPKVENKTETSNNDDAPEDREREICDEITHDDDDDFVR